ncbi:MAG: DUF885 family protein [Candidatus Njordarchaeia archaeon]
MNPDANFRLFVEEFINKFLHLYPTIGTLLGISDTLYEMEKYSSESKKNELKLFEKFYNRLLEFDKSELSFGNMVDWEILNRFFQKIFILEREMKIWERFNDLGSIIVNTLLPIVFREKLNIEEKANIVASKLDKFVEIGETFKKNCKQPMYQPTKNAISNIEKAVAFLNFLKEYFNKEIKETALRNRLLEATDKALSSIRDYKDFLVNKILPKANHDEKLGAVNLRDLLNVNGITESFDEILDMLEMEKNAILQKLKKISENLFGDESLERTMGEIEKKLEITGGDILSFYKKKIKLIEELLESEEIIPILHKDNLKLELMAKNLAQITVNNIYIEPQKYGDGEAIYLINGEKTRNIANVYISILEDVIPGNHLLYTWAIQHESILRYPLFASAPDFSYGWVEYGKRLILSLDKVSEEVKFIILADAYKNVVKAAAALLFHTGRIAEKDIPNYLKKEINWLSMDIEVERDEIISNPIAVISRAYGKIKICELKNKIKDSLGEKYRELAFHKAILEEGFMNLDLLFDVVEKKLVK